MEDLVRWLGEQLDEDERIALAATQGVWVWSREFVTPPGYHHRTVGPLEPGDAAYIATHDPARVLREIDAKRQLLALHEPGETEYVDGDVCMVCEDLDVGDEGPFYPCKTLRLLALPYADRPGYQDDWRP